jgi:hypothetical protein
MVAKAVPRDEKGRILPRPDSLGKTYGLRVRKDLDPVISELAAAEGLSPTEWCRKQIETVISETLKQKGKTQAM